MNFTREPIVETIITPKDGYKLVIRNSKGSGQEEFFVDSVEVISFGLHCFYRSMEKPKCFLVPVTDYEVLEVRETRMMLKMPGVERGIKIGGGREAALKAPREEKEDEEQIKALVEAEVTVDAAKDTLREKRREKRRFRKRRERGENEEEVAESAQATFPEPVLEEEPKSEAELAKPKEERALIPPPPTLISETISRYKDIPLFAGAFFDKDEKVDADAKEDAVEEEVGFPGTAFHEEPIQEEDVVALEEKENEE